MITVLSLTVGFPILVSLMQAAVMLVHFNSENIYIFVALRLGICTDFPDFNLILIQINLDQLGNILMHNMLYDYTIIQIYFFFIHIHVWQHW